MAGSQCLRRWRCRRESLLVAELSCGGSCEEKEKEVAEKLSRWTLSANWWMVGGVCQFVVSRITQPYFVTYWCVEQYFDVSVTASADFPDLFTRLAAEFRERGF